MLNYKFPGLRKPLTVFLMVFCIGGAWVLAAVDYLGYEVTSLPKLVQKKESFQIRRYVSSDRDAIEEILQSTPYLLLDAEQFETQKKLSQQFGHNFPYETPLEQGLANFTSDNIIADVMIIDNSLVGFITYGKEVVVNTINNKKQGLIGLVAVKEEFRRIGLGTKLLDRVSAYYKTINADIVALTVHHSNQSALAFYEKNGFKKGATLPGLGVSLLKDL